MKTFRTLAEFKRKLQVGDKLHTIHHMLTVTGKDKNLNPIYEDKDLGVRSVCGKMSDAFALATNDVPSWCNWPRASHCKIEDGKLKILVKDLRHFKGGLVREGNPEYDKLPFVVILTYSFAE